MAQLSFACVSCSAVVDSRIQFRIVVHLQLSLQFEPSFARCDVREQRVKGRCEVGALFFQQRQSFAVSLAMLLGRGGALSLLVGVKYLEREDGEPVDH